MSVFETQTAVHRRWTPEEIAILATYRGNVKEIAAKLPRRNVMAIRKRLSTSGICTKHIPWSYEEDTILRNTPEGDHVAHFREKLPNRSYHVCYHRYHRVIRPLLGKPVSNHRTNVSVETHMKLARTDEEKANLVRYYSERGVDMSSYV